MGGFICSGARWRQRPALSNGATAADRGCVLQTGRIVLADTAQNLLQNEMMKKAYLGT
jgi:ABC-type branched-subunit amino acid transport system ATPase component